MTVLPAVADEARLSKVSYVVVEVQGERARQDAKWGEQNHPDGTGLYAINRMEADGARERCQEAFAAGEGTWRHVLDEELAEAYAESDPAKLRAELIQLAAVAVAWVEAIDRRPSREAPVPIMEALEVPDRQEVQG